MIDVNEYGHITMKEASGYIGHSLPPIWRSTLTVTYGLTNAHKWNGLICDFVLDDEDLFRYRPESRTLFISRQSKSVVKRVRSASKNRKHGHQTRQMVPRIAPEVRTLRERQQPSWLRALPELPALPSLPTEFNYDELEEIRNPQNLQAHHAFLPTRYDHRTGADQLLNWIERMQL